MPCVSLSFNSTLADARAREKLARQSNHVLTLLAFPLLEEPFSMMAYRLLKRLADLCIATLMLLVFSPLFVLTGVVLWLWQGRPLLYRQRRIGWHGVPFTLYKFRTMVAAPPPRYADRPVAKQRDLRITPLGRFLRRTALDELPQLINIIRGEMSLVGPRPLPEDDLAQPGWLQGLPEQKRLRRVTWLAKRHQVLPGLTGRWQITTRPTEDFENWITSDLDYLVHPTLWGDLWIFICSPYAIVRGRRASAHALADIEHERPQHLHSSVL
jgi:lipopolysaccharide/colanic/teichoic acid biosynthesis glycosyltransferase